jgi:DNA-binding Lrp family transcriptional regulator
MLSALGVPISEATRLTAAPVGRDPLDSPGPMVTAIVLINCERAAINTVAEALADLPPISEVYSVGGRFDLVAIVRVKENDDLAALVTEQLARVEGIARTETLIAFRAISRHDLEGIFTIGFEQEP